MSGLQVVISLVGWLFLTVTRLLVHQLLDSASSLLTGALKAAGGGFQDGGSAIAKSGNWTEKRAVGFWTAIKSLLDKIVELMDPLVDALASHCRSMLRHIPSTDENRGTRIFGSVLFMAALGAFVYADMAQGANNLSDLFIDIHIPSFLNSLVVPLLVASGGSLLMLGVILFDLLRHTDLSRWSDMEGRLRNVFIGVVLATATTSIVLAVMIALVRSSEGYRQQAELAQSLLILPLLVTTGLLYWGVFGLLVVWVAAVGLLWAALRLTRAIVEFGSHAAQFVGKGAGALVTIFFTLISSGFRLAGSMFDWLSERVEPTFDFGKKAVDVVTGPIVVPFDRLTNYLEKRNILPPSDSV